jgi:DNA (cytosine-5)-methyltransferase 1
MPLCELVLSVRVSFVLDFFIRRLELRTDVLYHALALGIIESEKPRRLPVISRVETVASLFSGIGGIELGLGAAGLETILQCEICDAARAVLRNHFVHGNIKHDVTKLKSLPNVDLVAAGFPCQDLSQAGQGKGIKGKNSSLVNHVFSLVERKRSKPNWILLENVPFMLQLDQGKAMSMLVRRTEQLGYQWAYRVIDARAFGLPQRRKRVVFLASRTGNPRNVLLGESVEPNHFESSIGKAHGFYWTEGNKGLGWTNDGTPTLKGGSTIGIPSPPAIWMIDERSIVTPDIRDAERLQGFPANWTKAASEVGRNSVRWKLVGNAFPVPIGKWIGKRLNAPGQYDDVSDLKLERKRFWPSAAWGSEGEAFKSSVTEWPVRRKYKRLEDFLKYPTSPLSYRATAGFYSRAVASSLRFHPNFLSDVEEHMLAMEAELLSKV